MIKRRESRTTDEFLILTHRVKFSKPALIQRRRWHLGEEDASIKKTEVQRVGCTGGRAICKFGALGWQARVLKTALKWVKVVVIWRFIRT
jgi:hypothetical protein